MLWRRLRKISQITRDPFLISALLKGTAAGVEHKLVLQSLKCEYLVDIGANRGQFALIARKVFPQAKIHSFEPLKEPAQIFKKIFSNDPNVTLYPYAIGREKTTAIIHVTKDDDSSSMLPITKTQSSMFPGATEKETRQVSVLPLSQALGTTSIPPASLLKIDVQGFELDVLQGCEDILNKFSYVYVECSFVELYAGQSLAHEVISFLDRSGFLLCGIHNLYYDRLGLAIQADFLFKNRNAPA